MHHFGELLKTRRKHARLTQEALAVKARIDDSYISKIETGADRTPTRDIVVQLADALGIRRKTKEWVDFLHEAGVATKEDLEGFELVEVEDGQAEDDDFTFAAPLKTPQRRSDEDRHSDEAAQLRQLLAQVDALRARIEALIAEKEQQHGRTKQS